MRTGNISPSYPTRIALLTITIALFSIPLFLPAMQKGKRKETAAAPTGFIKRVNDTTTNEAAAIYVIEGNKIYDNSGGGRGKLAYEILDDHHYMEYRYSDDSGAGTVPSKFYYDDNTVIELCPNSHDTIGVFNGSTLMFHDNTGDTYEYSYNGDIVKKMHILQPKNFVYYYQVSGISPKLFIMFMLGGHCYH